MNKPKYGTWYFNAPQVTCTYREKLKENSHKRIKNNLVYNNNKIHRKTFPNPEEILTQNIIIQKEMETPVKFAPLHREKNQSSPYFTVNDGYGV